jgi:hypothetical protein
MLPIHGGDQFAAVNSFQGCYGNSISACGASRAMGDSDALRTDWPRGDGSWWALAERIEPSRS